MTGSITFGAGATTITSGTSSYNPVTVDALATLDVTGATTDVTLNGVSTLGLSTFNVSGGAVLDFAGIASVAIANSYNIGDGGTIEFGAGIGVAVLGAVSFTNTAGDTAVLDIDQGLSVSLLGAIDGWKSGDQIVLSGQTISGVNWTQNGLGAPGGTLTVHIGSATQTLTFGNGHYTNANFSIAAGNGVISFACFARGTLIEGADGPVAVQDLVEGSLVRVASGALRPVRWIGFRRVDLSRCADTKIAHPIRIVAGAFGDGMPRNDLMVSPDHALAIDGVLIPARMLVNGGGIRTETTAKSVEYFHVELESHDILLAEGLPAESYIDTGNRGMFENFEEGARLNASLSNEGGARRVAGSCLPLAVDEMRVKPIWDRLADRSISLGFAPFAVAPAIDDPAIFVLADGRPFSPVSACGDRYTFSLPRAASLRLISRAAAPADAKPWLDDRRRLGIMVKEMTRRGISDSEPVSVGLPVLHNGWFPVEVSGDVAAQWTNGDAAIGSTKEPTLLTVVLAHLSPVRVSAVA